MPYFLATLLGGQPHAEISVRLVFHQIRVGPGRLPHERNHAHAFHAAGKDNIGLTRRDFSRADRNGFQSRRAKTVQRDGGDALRQPGAEGGDAGDIEALLRFRRRAAENDIVYLLRRKARRSFQNRAEDNGGQIIGPGIAQSPFRRAPNGCPRRADNHDFSHGVPLNLFYLFLRSQAGNSSPCDSIWPNLNVPCV